MPSVHSYPDQPVIGSHGRVLRLYAGSVARGISSAVKRLQYARMKSVLAQMPDHHLKAIGIRRSQIPAYAHQLIHGID